MSVICGHRGGGVGRCWVHPQEDRNTNLKILVSPHTDGLAGETESV